MFIAENEELQPISDAASERDSKRGRDFPMPHVGRWKFLIILFIYKYVYIGGSDSLLAWVSIMDFCYKP